MVVNTLRTDRTIIAAHFDDSVRADSFKTDWNLVAAAVNGISVGYNLLTYGTTIAPNITDGNIFEIRATDTVAYAISNPLNPIATTISFIIKNGSGGTMGTITWDTAFKLGAAFDKPADTKYRVITFAYNGTSWFEVSRTAADIA